jgi:hypothetical protein
MKISMRMLAIVLLALSGPALATSVQLAPKTLRVDIQHSGDAKEEAFALDRVIVEPTPWPGNPARPLDDTNRGANRFDVVDAASGKLLYSRGYSTIFGEWRTTDESQSLRRSFQESLRFPMPAGPVELRVFGRDARNAFVQQWKVTVDPAALDVEREQGNAPAQPVKIHFSGDPATKVDLLILGDGYTQAELPKFEAKARQMAAHLFSVSPFKERASDFNVWALTVPVPASGVSRPSTGQHRYGATGLRYDIFGSERYALSLDNRKWRDLAMWAPYEFVEIVFNGQTYGGGGIFGQFSTAAADNDWIDYLFVHEFGHHFADLADEYYTSPTSYGAVTGEKVEPWQPNVTALHDPKHLKWASRLTPGVAVPTPWPKAEFEAMERDIQARRKQLRADRRPESEMTALFHEESRKEHALFDRSPVRTAVGAFEGGNYEAQGYYRPQMTCLMFDRDSDFCQVCSDAIEQIVDLYSKP